MGASFAHQTFRAQRLGSPFWLPAAALLPREGGDQENVNAGQYHRPTICAYAPTTSLRSCPSGSCWFVVEHFSGNVRWTNLIQNVKGLAPSAHSRLQEVDLVTTSAQNARGLFTQ
jgi:hypothetical protein